LKQNCTVYASGLSELNISLMIRTIRWAWNLHRGDFSRWGRKRMWNRAQRRACVLLLSNDTNPAGNQPGNSTDRAAPVFLSQNSKSPPAKKHGLPVLGSTFWGMVSF